MRTENGAEIFHISGKLYSRGNLMALSIPEHSHKALERLLSIDEETAEKLHEALSLKPHCLDLKCISKQVTEKAGIARAEAEDLVQLLFSIYTVRYDREISVSKMIAELRAAVEKLAKPALTSAFAQPAVNDRLEKLLSLEASFGIVVKGMAILFDHPCHFHAARILTDARPIFLSDAGKGPVSFLIGHTLKITIHEDGDDKDWFLALDSEDLEELKKTIDRALSKEKALTNALSAASFHVLGRDD